MEIPLHSQTTPLFVVLSGPSGVGKDLVLSRMRALERPYHYVVTVTTRPRRDNEEDGIAYHFVSLSQFWQMVEKGKLLEWANVYGNWYGVPKEQARQALDRGQTVILKADVQGAATIKRILPQGVFIFLSPFSFEELELRLRERHTESDFDLRLRLETAKEEIKRLSLFDYVVINRQGEVDRALSQIEAIITAEQCRVNPRSIQL